MKKRACENNKSIRLIKKQIVLECLPQNIEQIYIEVPKIWNQWIFSDKISTKVKKAKRCFNMFFRFYY